MSMDLEGEAAAAAAGRRMAGPQEKEAACEKMFEKIIDYVEGELTSESHHRPPPVLVPAMVQ
jgi:hypothetical protein